MGGGRRREELYLRGLYLSQWTLAVGRVVSRAVIQLHPPPPPPPPPPTSLLLFLVI